MATEVQPISSSENMCCESASTCEPSDPSNACVKNENAEIIDNDECTVADHSESSDETASHLENDKNSSHKEGEEVAKIPTQLEDNKEKEEICETPIKSELPASDRAVENIFHDDNASQPSSSCYLPPAYTTGLANHFAAAPVTVEAIQSIQLAIAQFAAKTIASDQSGQDHETAMKQLSFLQQTLFNLQQQQLFQIQLIQQLQSQLALNSGKRNENGLFVEGEGKFAASLPHHSDQVRTMDEEEEEEEGENGEEDTYEEEERLAEMELRQKVASRMAEDKARQHLINAGISVDSLKPNAPNATPLEDSDMNACENSHSEGPKDNLPTESAVSKDTENCPLPYDSELSLSIITHHDNVPQGNSLEMLQKRTQEVLDSASKGILANNMADELAFNDKMGDGSGHDAFFKHRCRYCGKIFGSDSALQIHIRSHTGERPFKCNVCGSRFTTKGNLKVHFQRHAHKFPHVPMNTTPIPEHLDKFHPPLLDQFSPDTSPIQTPHSIPSTDITKLPAQMSSVSLPMTFPSDISSFGAGFPGIYRQPLELLKSLNIPGQTGFANPFFPRIPGNVSDVSVVAAAAMQAQAAAHAVLNKSCQEIPTDLSKTSQPQSPEVTCIKVESYAEESPQRPSSTSPSNLETVSSLNAPLIKNEKDEEDSSLLNGKQIDTEKAEHPQCVEESMEVVTSTESSFSPTLQERCTSVPNEPTVPASTSSHILLPHMQPLRTSPDNQTLSPPEYHNNHFDHLSMTNKLPPSLHQRDNFFMDRYPEQHSPIRSPAHLPRPAFFGAIKPHDLALLPRPHSNDNSWENFIEISNSSETLKLKELMKNKKITDPNQCVVCDRVLSCKSALQMHYRTHTGERPFKCRICGRAFTTKGNLKTHMAVHKIRPPMRNFHQCPVCHKKYSNALVLQQHIRLHTGEPTDLTPEQIQAAEIREPPPAMLSGAFMNPFAAAAFHFGMPAGGHLGASMVPHNGGTLGSESSQGDMEEPMDGGEEFDDDMMSEQLSNNNEIQSGERPRSSEDFKGLHFEQKLRIDPNSMNSTEVRSHSATSDPIIPCSSSMSPGPTSKLPGLPSNIPTERSIMEISQGPQGALDLTPRSMNCEAAAATSTTTKRSPSPLSFGTTKSPKLSQTSPPTFSPLVNPPECLPVGLQQHLQHKKHHPQYHHYQQQQIMHQQAVAFAAAAQHQQQQQHNVAIAMHHHEQLRREAAQAQAQHSSSTSLHQSPMSIAPISTVMPNAIVGPPNISVATASLAPAPTTSSSLMGSRPPFGMFPNLPLFPPASTQNMCSAMNTIAQSVMPAAPFNPLALSGRYRVRF